MELRTGAILLKGHTKDGVYEWPVSSSTTSPLVAFSSVKTSSTKWHHRLGHPAFPILKHIVSHYQLDLSSSLISDFLCNACHCNKSHKLPFSTSTVVSSQPLEIIFSDVWTSPVISHDNFKYYVIFVDHFTKYIWFYPLQQKSEVKDVFIRFKAIVETHFQNKIHTLYSDNGGEYLALRPFLATHGITHFTTPPHTAEHNGYSERRHCHIVETGNVANELVNIINANRTAQKLPKLNNSPGLGCIALQYVEECKGNCTSNNTINCQPQEVDFTEVFAPNCGVELPTFGTITGRIVGCQSKYLEPSEAFVHVIVQDKKTLSIVRDRKHTEVGVGLIGTHRRGPFFWCVLFSSDKMNSTFVLEDGGKGIEQKKGCFSGTNIPCSGGHKTCLFLNTILIMVLIVFLCYISGSMVYP